MTIRRALEADLARIVEIYSQAVLHTVATFDVEPKTVNERKGWFEEHDDRFSVFVAEAETGIAGWSSLSRWSDRCAYDNTCEISVYVDEKMQRRGIGRLLLAQAIEHARTAEFHTILSRVASENDGSVRLHAAFGFSFIGKLREVGFKFGRLLDVDMFQLMLN